MKLNRWARRWYNLAIVTVPPVTAWEASFDGGTAWVAGEAATVDGTAVQRWLVAGPNATTGTATALTADTEPIVRATDNPEILAENAPVIALE